MKTFIVRLWKEQADLIGLIAIGAGSEEEAILKAKDYYKVSKDAAVKAAAV